jgi:hypothetical protein
MPTTSKSGIFINCPFDEKYKPLRHAMVFAVYRCGFLPRCVTESDDSGDVRVEKIAKIIGECRGGIHDISRTEPNDEGLPRFNMPFELGLFLGAKKLGGPRHNRLRCLILDREPYRYQKFISDIAGQDPKAHYDDPRQLVIAVRDWINVRNSKLPGGGAIWDEYLRFQEWLPVYCGEAKLDEPDLTFQDHRQTVYQWLYDREQSGEMVQRRDGGLT